MSLTIYPSTLRTPGTIKLYGSDLNEITKIRVTASRADDPSSSGYLGIAFTLDVPENSDYVSIPLTRKMFYDLGVGTGTTIELRFSGRLKSGEYAGMWTFLPLWDESKTVLVTAGDDCAPEIIGGSWMLVQPAGYSLATSQPLAGVTSMETECRVALYSVSGNPTVTGQLSGKVYSFAYVRDDGTWTKDGTAYPVKLYKATVGPIVAPQTDLLVTATEDGGLRSTEFTFSLDNVVNYEKPVLSINSCFRCNASGQNKDGGPNVSANVRLHYDTKVTGNGVKKLIVKLNGTTYNLTSGQTSIIGGALNENAKYTAVISGQDMAGSEVTREVILSGALKDFIVIRGSDNQGAHVGVGMTPSVLTGKSTVELPAGGQYILDGLPYGAFTVPVTESNDGLSFGKDFLNIDVNDRYAGKNAGAIFYKSATDSNFVNAPPAVLSSAFHGYRQVIIINASFALVILYEAFPTAGRIWINGWFYGWSGWKSLTPT